jgi:predicted hotdog family 3-hydroxylacyl-ACP dehydratase
VSIRYELSDRLGITIMFDIKIEDLIPHRNSMKLLDEIIEIDDSHCITSATVSSDWPLIEDGYIDPIILIELAAQTAGVSFGWHEYQQGKLTIGRLGWLVGIKSAGFYRDKIPVNSKIIMAVEDRKSDDIYAEISCTASLESETIASMVLQVFRTETK